MIRLTDLLLPLDHPPEALAEAICARLEISTAELEWFAVARRGNDARKKHAIRLVYSLDLVVADEEAVLARFADDPHVRPTPDTAYRFVTRAPENYSGPRPVVIGAGPCGLLAALVLAQMGFRPIIIERGTAVRERTKDTWGLWRRGVLKPESNAGVMYAANYGSVQHTMGFLPGLKAFTAAVFGGIGNLPGAMVGGVLLGLIESLGAGYIGALTGGVLGSHYQDIFAFIVLILVLTLRPQGLLGERVADRA